MVSNGTKPRSNWAPLKKRDQLLGFDHLKNVFSWVLRLPVLENWRKPRVSLSKNPPMLLFLFQCIPLYPPLQLAACLSLQSTSIETNSRRSNDLWDPTDCSSGKGSSLVKVFRHHFWGRGFGVLIGQRCFLTLHCVNDHILPPGNCASALQIAATQCHCHGGNHMTLMMSRFLPRSAWLV